MFYLPQAIEIKSTYLNVLVALRRVTGCKNSWFSSDRVECIFFSLQNQDKRLDISSSQSILHRWETKQNLGLMPKKYYSDTEKKCPWRRSLLVRSFASMILLASKRGWPVLYLRTCCVTRIGDFVLREVFYVIAEPPHLFILFPIFHTINLN